MFEQGEQAQVRERLASTLRYIISQRLAPKIGGGRQLLTEIMGSNLRTREIVQLGESESAQHARRDRGRRDPGWHSFEQDIIQHFSAGRITEETAMLYSVNKSTMRQALDRAKKNAGLEDQTPHGFRLSPEHNVNNQPPPPMPRRAINPSSLPPHLPAQLPPRVPTPAPRPPAPAPMQLKASPPGEQAA